MVWIWCALIRCYLCILLYYSGLDEYFCINMNSNAFTSYRSIFLYCSNVVFLSMPPIWPDLLMIGENCCSVYGRLISWVDSTELFRFINYFYWSDLLEFCLPLYPFIWCSFMKEGAFGSEWSHWWSEVWVYPADVFWGEAVLYIFLMSVFDLRTSVFKAFSMWKVRLLSSKADCLN